MNVCVVITVAMVGYSDHLLLMDFGLFETIYHRCHGNVVKGGLLCVCTATQLSDYNFDIISYLRLRYMK
jgi:hypothetical protein